MSNRTQITRKSKPKPNDGLTRKQRATRRLLRQPWPTKEIRWASIGYGSQASLVTHVMLYDGEGKFLSRVPRAEYEASLT